MRPVMTSPCSVCGATLTHDHDPRKVLCPGCEADARAAARENAPPPPTVEWHKNAKQQRLKVALGAMHILALIMVAAAGFFWGWIARGGQ